MYRLMVELSKNVADTHRDTHTSMYRHPLHNANKSSLQAPYKTLKSVPTECAGPLLWPAPVPVPHCSAHCREGRVQPAYIVVYTSVSLSLLACLLPAFYGQCPPRARHLVVCAAHGTGYATSVESAQSTRSAQSVQGKSIKNSKAKKEIN